MCHCYGPGSVADDEDIDVNVARMYSSTSKYGNTDGIMYSDAHAIHQQHVSSELHEQGRQP